MSTTPPEQGGTGGGAGMGGASGSGGGARGQGRGPDVPMGYTIGSSGSIARLPLPGNAEFAVYLVVTVFLVILWIAMAHYEVTLFTWHLTILTAFYLVSRGIAKASRVLEV